MAKHENLTYYQNFIEKKEEISLISIINPLFSLIILK